MDEEALRQRFAYHEAGHAVIGRVVGMTCGHVTIAPDDDSDGHSIVDDPYDIAGAWERRGKFRDLASVFRGRIISYMAGREAEDEILGAMPEDVDYGDGDDRFQVRRMLGELTLPDGQDAAGYETRLRAKTRSLVRRHSATIQRVAEALLQQETLTAEEADDLVGAVVVMSPALTVEQRIILEWRQHRS